MKYVKIPASYEEVDRIKAENRAKKAALLANMSDAEKRRYEEQLSEKIADDFQGWSSSKSPKAD
jgi:hypothetical protein